MNDSDDGKQSKVKVRQIGKRGGARPGSGRRKSADADRLVQVMFNARQDELIRFRAEADAAGLSLSAWCRHTLMERLGLLEYRRLVEQNLLSSRG